MSVNTVHTVDTVEGDPELAAQSAADVIFRVKVLQNNRQTELQRDSSISSQGLRANHSFNCLPVILENLYSEDEDLLTTLKAKLTEPDPNEREASARLLHQQPRSPS
jgi:hypothetical protein